MSHYVLAPHPPSAFSYPTMPLSAPRDRYLAALAQAKAAEAEYVAAEAVQQEEDALRRRLEEIRLRKREEEVSLGSRYGRRPYFSSDPLLNLETYPTSGYDRLAAARRQFEEEERLRFLALRQGEAEQQRRRQAEELRLRSLMREEQAALRLRRQQEEARAAALTELRAAKALQRHYHYVGQHRCNCVKQASARPSCRRPCRNGCQQTAAIEVDVQELLNQLFGYPPVPPKPQNPHGAPQQPAPGNCSPTTAVEEVTDIAKQFANLFGLSTKEAQQQLTAQADASSSNALPVSPAVIEPVQQAYDLFFGQSQLEVKPAPEAQQTSAALGSSRTPEASPTEQLEGRLNNDYATEVRDTIQAILTSPRDAITSDSSSSSAAKERAADTSSDPSPLATLKASSPSKTVETSLEEQLEARLNNEYFTEVRDTIQAIFASLQNAESHSPAASTSPNSAGSSKGKEKAAESSTDPSPSATSKDVVNAMNEVRSIEAAFQALEGDFTFPAQLDFLAAHLASGSPAASDSEASATVHLAYTSRNHPVRFYEQALSALLAQLDSVDSFGNEGLRAMRKEVVNRVERALDELEKEVEGRWRTRLAKEAKPVTIQVTEAVPTQPAAALAKSAAVPSDRVSSHDVPEEKADVTTGSAAEEHSFTPAPMIATPDAASESSAASAPPMLPTVTDTISAVPEPLVTDSTVSPSSQPSAPTEVFDTSNDIPSSSTSLAASIATLQGYDVEAPAVEAVPASPVELEPVDAFLLSAASDADAVPKRPHSKDSHDVESDWSEVEA
ncbi:putative BAG domain containing protein [Lyophyllum shimeji]|uniref:BAG domain containing protein n=1 Tax=Lyophyllum shimeji TaxID=47721 RepID=A0A9P3PJD1_LYOSH|nr:putative BAG domain containing protein [Lyophyllum shimeji]